ncbi:MAG: acyl-CoA dehydrogenase [Myxococcales bacterium]|nr:acyl-CoA dehydrogenase [Myxococcales bacterium]
MFGGVCLCSSVSCDARDESVLFAQMRPRCGATHERSRQFLMCREAPPFPHIHSSEQIMTTSLPIAAPGGAFLVEPTGQRHIFTPEEFDEIQLSIAEQAHKFMEKEVVPHERLLESKQGKADEVMVDKLRKACELGFALVEVPEQYDGLGADKRTALLLCEKLGANGDFSVTYGAHCGIGLAPILLFGTAEQKKKYATRIGTGELVSCYALSEPGSGSDALAARTTAVLNEAGTHYIFNGTKQWISNAAWADVAIVFAKVDGDKFTAFIVDRDTPGFSIGAEEHKLGLRGSSTCQLIFNDAPVPKENVLGEIGKGHHVAFNTLNLGRFKLGASVIGGAKRAIQESLAYATDRQQFRTRVVDFGAIREMVADCVVQVYLGEALNYRIAGMIDARLEGQDHTDPKVLMKAVEEYVIEASISKVYSSEALDRIIDRCFQWHGGYGFVEEYCIEKFFRDSRVNRIFEGTNEINRLLVPGTLIKRVMTGRLEIDQAMADMERRIASGDLPALPADDGLDRALFALQRLKWLAMTVFQAATARFGISLDKEQETLVGLANLIIDAYAVDSAIARATQQDSDEAVSAVCKVAAYEALDRGVVASWRLMECIFDGHEDFSDWASKLDKLSAHVPANIVRLKRVIAKGAVDAGQYHLSAY